LVFTGSHVTKATDPLIHRNAANFARVPLKGYWRDLQIAPSADTSQVPKETPDIPLKVAALV
jgi:hypothetical protein